MSIEDRLRQLDLKLPEVPAAVGAYIPAVQSGRLVYVSGQLPLLEGRLAWTGKVGRDLTTEQAGMAARICVLNVLAAVRTRVQSLENVSRIVRLEVFVNSEVDYTDQAKVANGASNLLHDLFGAAGQHARLAAGVAALPLNAPVEISAIVEIDQP